MLELSLCEHGVRVGNHLYNSFAYADDVSLFSTTVPGLEKKWLIYAQIIHPYGVLISASKRQNVWWYVNAIVVFRQRPNDIWKTNVHKTWKTWIYWV